jgi:ATP-binding cassette subfamily C protein
VLDSSSRDDSEITGDDVNSLKSLIDPFDGSVKLESVMVTYPTAEAPSLIDINLSIPKGTFTAIVGPSGAGKSTLADCILGIVKPSEGKVWVSGVAPSKAIKLWPGKIGYVPQEIYLSRKSVADNILFEITANKNSENRDLKLKEALTVAGALSFVSSLPLGAETEIGEEGSQLSGGQRQRLGIARALYPNPELLVLDEATSALDALSENALTEELLGMRGSRTLIVIAHRLSTVQSADSIVFLQNGRIKGMGTFGELYDQNKDFADQVDAMKMREER